jgi:hypothetical protein
VAEQRHRAAEQQPGDETSRRIAPIAAHALRSDIGSGRDREEQRGARQRRGGRRHADEPQRCVGREHAREESAAAPAERRDEPTESRRCCARLAERVLAAARSSSTPIARASPERRL